MTDAPPDTQDRGDVRQAFQLLAIAPQLGGLCLRGDRILAEAWLEAFRNAASNNRMWRRLPHHVALDRLNGGIDIAASLASGKPVGERGLLDELADGVAIITLADRLDLAIAGLLAQRLDASSTATPPTLILLDESAAEDAGPPPSLLDRVAFHLDVDGSGAPTHGDFAPTSGISIGQVDALDDADLNVIASVAAALGVRSARAMNFAALAARASAALDGRTNVRAEHLQLAMRLVLASRATQTPEVASAPPAPPPSAQDGDNRGEDASEGAGEMPERTLSAALASIPDDLIEFAMRRRLARAVRGAGKAMAGQSDDRGRPLGARPGRPRNGSRLALIDTLRAAVPWQRLRQQCGNENGSNIRISPGDLRIRRFKERKVATTIFCVDASGSAALARLAEAKGAVERLLAQAYVKRSEVALIAFRGERAEVILPPTRSLTRARRVLAELPGGGGTPLASGIVLARQWAARGAAAGRSPFLVFLTDGSANIALDGAPGRPRAREDAMIAARGVAADDIAALLIDISPRPRPDAETIAATMNARYLPLPAADAQSLARAVEAARPVAGA